MKKYDWTIISEFYKNHSYKETRQMFGFSKAAWDKARERGEIQSRGYQDLTIPLKDILVENSTYQTSHLKRRLFEQDLLQEQCAWCGLGSSWNGKPISLHLDHINGVNNDHRLINLRVLCPNCHSQTNTYAGRNAKAKHVSPNL